MELIYVDGSALARFVLRLPESAAWQEWADRAVGRLVTTPLGLTELRRAADPLGIEARDAARAVADELTVVRFSDQTLKTAAMASTVLSPFASIHLGTAVAHPDIQAMATYDEVLARVAVIYALDVVAPGRPDGWWEG